MYYIIALFCRYRLRNQRGMQVELIDLGGIITKIRVPDKDNKLADITLGYDKLEGNPRGKKGSFSSELAVFMGHLSISLAVR